MDTDFFRFEDKYYDIPFYNEESKLNKKNILILFIGLCIAGSTPVIIPTGSIPVIKGLIICLSTLIPVIYVFKHDLESIFRIPKAKDILVIIVGTILMILFGILVNYLMSILGITPHTNYSVVNDPIKMIITAVIQLIGEELLKLIVILLIMAMIYKYVGRKTSIFLSVIMSQITFSLFHIPAYGFDIIYLLIGIGLGSLPLALIYVKTKNIFICYIVHLLNDLIAFVPIFLGMTTSLGLL